MAALTELHRLFVLELADQKVLNYRQAYIKAGYSSRSLNAVNVESSRLAGDPRTIAALEEIVGARIKMALPMAVSVIAELAQTPGKDQFRAAKEMKDTAGYSPMQRIEKKVTHEAVLTEPQLLDSIRSLCGLMRIDPNELIGSRLGKIIEGEFEELTDTEDDHEEADLTETDEDDAGVEEAPAVSFEGLEGVI